MIDYAYCELCDESGENDAFDLEGKRLCWDHWIFEMVRSKGGFRYAVDQIELLYSGNIDRIEAVEMVTDAMMLIVLRNWGRS